MNGKETNFFVQVNIGDEPQKSGLKISEVDAFVKWCINDMDLKVTGLMCIHQLMENHLIILIYFPI